MEINSLGFGVRSDVLALIWLVMTTLVLVLVVSKGKILQRKGYFFVMNVMTVILILFPLIRLTIYSWALGEPLVRRTEPEIHINLHSDEPDIYFIVLDSYTRNDTMETEFGYDNSTFIASLKDMGFYVAECSQSNYGATSLSLASEMNMDYLQNISPVFQPDETDLMYAFKALDDNLLRQTLTHAGYKTVVFASGFNWIEWRDADYFLSPVPKGLSEFELMILFSSYARIVDDFGVLNFDDLHAEHYRQRTRYVLNSFDEVLDLPSPKFVFIHVITPHEPYGFDGNGNDIEPDHVIAKTGYSNQAKFISLAILPHLRNLIENSDTPPVIILQGDHGSLSGSPQSLMNILNAYYLPGHESDLYPSITPVNSFRVVFNNYFGANLPLLEDVSYYSTLSERYNFTVMPNTCK
jgi:hypothetical protein